MWIHFDGLRHRLGLKMWNEERKNIMNWILFQERVCPIEIVHLPAASARRKDLLVQSDSHASVADSPLLWNTSMLRSSNERNRKLNSLIKFNIKSVNIWSIYILYIIYTSYYVKYTQKPFKTLRNLAPRSSAVTPVSCAAHDMLVSVPRGPRAPPSPP